MRWFILLCNSYKLSGTKASLGLRRIKIKGWWSTIYTTMMRHIIEKGEMISWEISFISKDGSFKSDFKLNVDEVWQIVLLIVLFLLLRFTIHAWFQFLLYNLRFSVWRKKKLVDKRDNERLSAEQWACLLSQNGSFDHFLLNTFRNFLH